MYLELVWIERSKIFQARGGTGVKIERKMHILEKRLTPCSQTASQTVKVHLFLLLVRLEMRFLDALIHLFAK